MAAREPTVNAVIAEKKYTLFGTLLIKNAVIGIVIPEISVAPLVSHWARLDDTPKYFVKFGIIFAVTVVDIDVINAAASSVIKIPVLCTFEILFLSLIIFCAFQIVKSKYIIVLYHPNVKVLFLFSTFLKTHFDVYLIIKIITAIATNSSVIGIANQIKPAPAKAGSA